MGEDLYCPLIGWGVSENDTCSIIGTNVINVGVYMYEILCLSPFGCCCSDLVRSCGDIDIDLYSRYERCSPSVHKSSNAPAVCMFPYALVDECVALELSFGCLRHGLVDSLPNIDTGSSKKGCQAVQLLKIVGSRLRQGWITCVTEELNSYLNSILIMRNLL